MSSIQHADEGENKGNVLANEDTTVGISKASMISTRRGTNTLQDHEAGASIISGRLDNADNDLLDDI